MDCSPPGSSVHGILHARVLVWIAISSFRRSSQPRGGTHVSFISSIAGVFFTTELLVEPPSSLNSHVRINNSLPRGLDWRIHVLFISLPFPWTRHFSCFCSPWFYPCVFQFVKGRGKRVFVEATPVDGDVTPGRELHGSLREASGRGPCTIPMPSQFWKVMAYVLHPPPLYL